MKKYETSEAVSSYLLACAAEGVRGNTDSLAHWAQPVGRLVYGGHLEFSKAWHALWLAAVAGGLSHIEAQQRIGEAFAAVKREQVEQ